MKPSKLVMAFALLLSAASMALAQDNQSQRPGPYYGNDYGPDNSNAQASPGAGKAPQH